MNKIYSTITATALLLLVGCDQEQSRFQIVSQYGKTLRIDKMTGKTHRFDDGAWVEVEERSAGDKVSGVGAVAASPAKSIKDLVRERYEKMTDAELDAEHERLKELYHDFDFRAKSTAEEKEDTLDFREAEEGIEIIHQIRRLRRLQAPPSTTEE